MNSDSLSLANGLGRNVAFTATSTTTKSRQFAGFIIQYVGASASALLTVGATTLVATVGVAGAEAADANFTVGATPGTIDLANAAANTAGELVDFVNSLSDWKMRLVGLRRADVISTSGYFVAATTQQVKVSGGYAVNYDTAVALHVTAELSIMDGAISAGVSGQDANTRYLRRVGGINGDMKMGSLVEVHKVEETLTYTGTPVFEVVEVDDSLQTDEVLYSSVIPGATTVAGSATFGQLGVSGVSARVGRRLLVRARAGTTLSAVTQFTVMGKLKALNV